MAITLEPARLDMPFGDGDGVLAKRDGRLFAILSCLGDLHGTLVGQWYVEAAFALELVEAGRVFPHLDEFEAEVASRLSRSRAT